MAVTQRITGGEDPAWPDPRDPGPRPQRRRWPWAVGLAVIAAGTIGGYLFEHQEHRAVVVDGLSCSSDRLGSTIIDYSWTSGPHSPEDALRAFLHSAQAKGLPRSGYVRPKLGHVPLSGDVAPSVLQPFDYVHLRSGKVDVGFRLEKSGGIWEVAEVRTCA